MSMTTMRGDGDTSTQEQRNIKDQAKEQVQKAVQKSQEKVGDVVQLAATQAKSRITEKKDEAAHTLDTMASAIREAGHQLQSKDQTTLGSAAEDAARTVGNVSDYLRESDVDEFVQQAESFARRQPIGFLAGALALGYIAGRFLAASSNKENPSRSSMESPSLYDTPALPETTTDDAAPNYSATVTSSRGISEVGGPYADNDPDGDTPSSQF